MAKNPPDTERRELQTERRDSHGPRFRRAGNARRFLGVLLRSRRFQDFQWKRKRKHHHLRTDRLETVAVAANIDLVRWAADGIRAGFGNNICLSWRRAVRPDRYDSRGEKR